jgi:hypothetical protein
MAIPLVSSEDHFHQVRARPLAVGEQQRHAPKLAQMLEQVVRLLNASPMEFLDHSVLNLAVLPSLRLRTSSVQSLAEQYLQHVSFERMASGRAHYLLRTQSTGENQLRTTVVVLDPRTRELVRALFLGRVDEIVSTHGRHLLVIGTVPMFLAEHLAFALAASFCDAAQNRDQSTHPEREYVFLPLRNGVAAVSEALERTYRRQMLVALGNLARAELSAPARVAAQRQALDDFNQRIPPERLNYWMYAEIAIVKRISPLDIVEAMGLSTSEADVEKVRQLMKRLTPALRTAEFVALCRSGLMTPIIAAWMALEDRLDVSIARKSMHESRQGRVVQAAFERMQR